MIYVRALTKINYLNILFGCNIFFNFPSFSRFFSICLAVNVDWSLLSWESALNNIWNFLKSQPRLKVSNFSIILTTCSFLLINNCWTVSTTPDSNPSWYKDCSASASWKPFYLINTSVGCPSSLAFLSNEPRNPNMLYHL